MNTDESKVRYEALGFLHLPGLIEPDLVARVREAFDAAADAYRPEWAEEVRAGRADGRYCDIPDILDKGDCFVDLVDHPRLLPHLLTAVGPDLQLNHTHARLFPPGPTHTAPWHSDLADTLGIDLGHSLNFFVKVHVFFEDLRPDQGCLAFIPGSHRLPRDYPRPAIPDPAASPAVAKVVPKAGDVVLFNTHTLHMALDNTSPRTRKSLIYAYSHFWVKHYANSVPKDLGRYATTPLRRQLFGVEEEGVSYFDRRYDAGPRPGLVSSFHLASRRALRRVFGSGSASWRR